METSQKTFHVNLLGEKQLLSFTLPHDKPGSDVGNKARYCASQSLNAPFEGIIFRELRPASGASMSPEAVSGRLVSDLPSGATVVLEQATPPVWRDQGTRGPGDPGQDNQMVQLMQQFKGMLEQANQFKEEATQRFATLEQSRDQQGKVNAQLRTDIVMLEQQNSELKEQKSKQEQKIRKLEQENSKLGMLGERVGKQEAEIAQLQRDKGKQAGEIYSLKQRSEKQAACINDLQLQCDEKNNTIQTLRGSVASLEMGMAGMQERENGIALRALFDGARLKMNGGSALNPNEKKSWNSRVRNMEPSVLKEQGTSPEQMELTLYGGDVVELGNAAAHVVDKVVVAKAVLGCGSAYEGLFEFVYGEKPKDVVKGQKPQDVVKGS